MNTLEQKLTRLSLSKFRSKFYLSDKDRLYIKEKGLETIKKHAYDFIKNRIAKENILNDGSQTPMHGHPVFIAQHATATCCRKCLNKWHHIPLNKELNNKEINYIVDLIMLWINKQL